jgi:hypothetical protein
MAGLSDGDAADPQAAMPRLPAGFQRDDSLDDD